MLNKLAAFLTRHGVTRDDEKLWWSQIVALAGLIVSGTLDVTSLGHYLGIAVSLTLLHRILAGCTAILWLSGRLSTSPLFGKDEEPMAWDGGYPPMAKPLPPQPPPPIR